MDDSQFSGAGTTAPGDVSSLPTGTGNQGAVTNAPMDMLKSLQPQSPIATGLYNPSSLQQSLNPSVWAMNNAVSHVANTAQQRGVPTVQHAQDTVNEQQYSDTAKQALWGHYGLPPDQFDENAFNKTAGGQLYIKPEYISKPTTKQPENQSDNSVIPTANAEGSQPDQTTTPSNPNVSNNSSSSTPQPSQTADLLQRFLNDPRQSFENEKSFSDELEEGTSPDEIIKELTKAGYTGYDPTTSPDYHKATSEGMAEPGVLSTIGDFAGNLAQSAVGAVSEAPQVVGSTIGGIGDIGGGLAKYGTMGTPLAPIGAKIGEGGEALSTLANAGGQAISSGIENVAGKAGYDPNSASATAGKIGANVLLNAKMLPTAIKDLNVSGVPGVPQLESAVKGVVSGVKTAGTEIKNAATAPLIPSNTTTDIGDAQKVYSKIAKPNTSGTTTPQQIQAQGEKGFNGAKEFVARNPDAPTDVKTVMEETLPATMQKVYQGYTDKAKSLGIDMKSEMESTIQNAVEDYTKQFGHAPSASMVNDFMSRYAVDGKTMEQVQNSLQSDTKGMFNTAGQVKAAENEFNTLAIGNIRDKAENMLGEAYGGEKGVYGQLAAFRDQMKNVYLQDAKQKGLGENEALGALIRAGLGGEILGHVAGGPLGSIYAGVKVLKAYNKIQNNPVKQFSNMIDTLKGAGLKPSESLEGLAGKTPVETNPLGTMSTGNETGVNAPPIPKNLQPQPKPSPLSTPEAQQWTPTAK